MMFQRGESRSPESRSRSGNHGGSGSREQGGSEQYGGSSSWQQGGSERHGCSSDSSSGKGRRPAAYPSLPAGYDMCGILDMAGDRDVFKRLAWSSLFVAAAMAVYGFFVVSPGRLFDLGLLRTALAVFLTVVGMVVYVFAHEWVHGVFIRMFTGEPAQFGFMAGSGMAYAKSSWFFSRPAYIVVALAPVLVWGIVLAVLAGDVAEEYFWCLYVIQIFNISGAVGDLYVTWLVMKMPAGVVILDQGTSMKCFAPVSFAAETDEEN